MKKYIQFLSGLILVLMIIMVIKTMIFTSLQIKSEPAILPGFGDESIANLSKVFT
jgi:hypothetical protein